MRFIYFKLRANVELEGDVLIAEREIKFFCEIFYEVKREAIEDARKELNLPMVNYVSNARKSGIIGFIGKIKDKDIHSILIRSSFIQEIWVDNLLETESKLIGKPFGLRTSDDFYCFVPLFPMTEFLTYLKRNEVFKEDISLITSHLSNVKLLPEIEKVVYKTSTSTPHAHGIHKYKAKFFPRLIRTFLVTEASCEEDVVVLDPFVGSGTTLLESSFLGFESIGVDIDKLSCLISEGKLSMLESPPFTIRKEYKHSFHHPEEMVDCSYKFPSWISRKFDRSDTTSVRDTYEKEISEIMGCLGTISQNRKLFQTIISDALCRKFNIRMMGTGVGRFALEIRKTPLTKIVSSNMKFLAKAASVIETVSHVYGVELKKPIVVNGNATCLDVENDSIDIILTSPPYLPGSSGREDYLIGKSISITALGLMDEEGILQAELDSIGSMKNKSQFVENELPEKVYELYHFLKNDRLRSIKAEPSYSYYTNIKKSLEESYRVLKPNAKAIYVIGKESVFYTFKTREVLFKVECDKIFIDLAKTVGFSVKEIIHIELNKKNRNARPRALDKYFETVVILEKK
jgi:DNA modification methylase